MLKLSVNTAFINDLFSSPTICGMENAKQEGPAHPSFDRLLQAIKDGTGKVLEASNTTEIALLMDTSPQRVQNWKDRGLSKEGALKAEELWGCYAVWLMDGKLPPPFGTGLSPEVAAEAAKIDRIIRTDPARRTFALTMLQYAQGAPIRTQEQIVELVVELSKQLQPT